MGFRAPPDGSYYVSVHTYRENAQGPGTVTPLPFAWDVGSIGVKYDEPERRIVVVLEELAEEDEKPATARFCFTLPQAKAFGHFALDLVAQGRPDCGLCGLPIDSDGHACPRMN